MKKFFNRTRFSPQIIILVIFVLVVTLFHFYRLGQVPVTLNPDEASIGYNAFLLRQTGKDEWGKSWPFVLQAFGDQKLIGYPALVVAAFQLFGYADWVIKLPSLLAGSCLVGLMYLLIIQMKKSKLEALIGAFLIGVVPVFFFYSRVGFEAMVALTCLLIALNLFFSGSVKKKSRRIRLLTDFMAVIFCLGALLTYNSPLLLIPIIMAATVLDRGLIHWRKWLPLFGLVTLTWLSFLIYFWPLTIQKSKITLFGDATVLAEFDQYRAHFSGLNKTILGNKYFFYSEKILVNYAKSWSPGFLMNNVGGHPWHTVPGYGYLVWSVYSFGIIGMILTLVRVLLFFIYQPKKRTAVYKLVLDGNSAEVREIALLGIFLLSLVPVIITVNAPLATRSLLFLFLWCYYAAQGIWNLSIYASKRVTSIFEISKIKSEFIQILLITMCLGVVFFESINYFHFYFTNYANNLQLESMFEPGFYQFIQRYNLNSPQPLAIVDERGFNYILVAWYLKVDPDTFFTTIRKQQPDLINFRYGEQLGRYHFIAKPADRRVDERQVLEWNKQTNQWQIISF